MKVKYLAVLLILLWSINTYSQGLYMPRNVKAAYKAGLRSMDGKPSPKYFQNKSTHNIKISVTPPSRRVNGSQDIVFTNNSPQPLGRLILRLEMNAHAPEAAREKNVDARQLTADAVIDEFSENGKARPWKPLIDTKGLTLNAVDLEKPIPPGGSTTVSFRWHYDLAEKSDRDGAIDETTFYIAYFYPRVAVLDNVNGWDTDQHLLGGHEFYAEFNDYNVEVTVPKNFIVWGTGNLTNIEEVLQPKHAERLRRSLTSDEVIRVASAAEIKAGTVTAQTPTVTWKWRSDFVPDIVYGLSDHYNWDASSLIVDRKTGRRVATQAAYDDPSKNFANMVTYIKSALDFASNDWPGIPYPYPKMTIFRGSADMEAPMMANDSSQEDPQMQHFIAAHEILHTYFPFYMGINERRYSFMEEGWTTAFEHMFNTKRFGKEFTDPLFVKYRVNGWINGTDSSTDLPIMTPEQAVSGLFPVYGDNKYGKAALGYLALKELLGDSDFRKGLHGFMNDWNGKHPIPWDMFYSFNTHTGKELNWFWNAWFFSNGYIDHAITDVKTESGSTLVTIQNIGGYPAPADLVVTFNDGSTETIRQGPDVWRLNMKETLVRLSQPKAVRSLVLNGGIFMDANPADNKWPK
ncbi:MAG: M1 family metallopeptidase [Pyrinomonadaceae bacterium]|nr:M1 family metallopeptidase [Acidobacteriota bacterium]MBP7375202.1 M1 family metallopeptidase [Pyrinomonadaceae bacterium]